MTQTTAPDDSAPPPYHLATLYPPVNSHQQMNPPTYAEVIFVWWFTDEPSTEHEYHPEVDVNIQMHTW